MTNFFRGCFVHLVNRKVPDGHGKRFCTMIAVVAQFSAIQIHQNWKKDRALLYTKKKRNEIRNLIYNEPLV